MSNPLALKYDKQREMHKTHIKGEAPYENLICPIHRFLNALIHRYHMPPNSKIA